MINHRKNKNMQTAKVFFAIVLACSMFLPVSAVAQTADANQTGPDAPPASDSSSDQASMAVIIVVDEQAPVATPARSPAEDSVSPQDTAIGQTANTANSLESTFDPHSATAVNDPTVEPASPPVVDIPVSIDDGGVYLLLPSDGGGSAPIDLSVNPTDTSEPAQNDPANKPPPFGPPANLVPSQIQNVQKPIAQFTSQPDPVATITIKEPESMFSFKLEKQAIAAEKIPDWQEKPSETNKDDQIAEATDITAAPNLAPSQEDGLNISGVCADKYFVVLLYANAGDYDENPASYIFNRAFDCVNGQYAYLLKDLPETLKDGAYYLLIAAQGDKGSWRPDSALIPITIKKNPFQK